jgi:hypothetical protein
MDLRVIMNSMTEDEQIILTKDIMLTLDSWGMSAAEIVTILALPEKTPTRALRRYRENTAFPFSVEVVERLEHILGITDALRTSFPHNPNMSSMWIRQKNKKLNNQIPLKIIIDKGLQGLIDIRQHVDCSYDWLKNP